MVKVTTSVTYFKEKKQKEKVLNLENWPLHICICMNMYNPYVLPDKSSKVVVAAGQ